MLDLRAGVDRHGERGALLRLPELRREADEAAQAVLLAQVCGGGAAGRGGEVQGEGSLVSHDWCVCGRWVDPHADNHECPGSPEDRIDELEAEVERLRERVESLEARLRMLEPLP